VRPEIKLAMGKAVHEFNIRTLVTADDPVLYSTSLASITLFPASCDQKASGEAVARELVRAEVVLRDGGSLTDESRSIAKKELIKILLTQIGTQARIVGEVTRSRMYHKKPEGPKTTTQILLTSNACISAPISCNSALRLKVDINATPSDSICQFYEALAREHPVDKYRELHKVWELLGGKDCISGNEIDLHELTAMLANKGKPVNDPIIYLWELRNWCSHKKPNYGMDSMSPEHLSELKDALPFLEKVVKYLIETHLDTKA